MAQITKTAEQILISWINWRKNQGKRLFQNSDMAKCKKFGEENFDQTYIASTYERYFRQFREKYYWRFEDVSDQYPNRRQKTWKLKPKSKTDDKNKAKSRKHDTGIQRRKFRSERHQVE